MLKYIISSATLHAGNLTKEKEYTMATKKAVSGFDIKKNNFSELSEVGYEFEVLTPYGTETGAFITARGEYSPTAKAYDRRAYENRQTEIAVLKKQNKEWKPSLERFEEEQIDRAIMLVKDWKGFTEDGVEIPFNRENAQRVFEANTYILDQVLEAAKVAVNFQPK